MDFSGFYRALDSSKLLTMVEKITSGTNPHGVRLLGAGYHFSAYLYSADGVEMVIKIAHDYGNVTPSKRELLENIGIIGRMDLPMVPPLVTLDSDGFAVYLMPFFPNYVASSPFLSNALQVMKRQNYYLRDIPQVRSLFGEHFIVDWSDLCTG